MQVLQVSLSVASDSVTLWTVACQAPLSMGFFRQEYGDFLNPGIEPKSPALQVDSLAMSHQGSIRCGSQKENFHLLACS